MDDIGNRYCSQAFPPIHSGKVAVMAGPIDIEKRNLVREDCRCWSGYRGRFDFASALAAKDKKKSARRTRQR